MRENLTAVLQSVAPSLPLEDEKRICPPKDTIARVMRLAPVMGITRLANITGLDTIGIPVYTAHRPNSRSLSVMQGKGYTHDAAKASALMEAVETWHAENMTLPLRFGSYAELCCKNKIADVSILPKFRDHAFTPHARIMWVEGDDLISGEKKFVPYEMVHMDYRSPLPCGHGCFTPSSNGLASGNDPLEALIHGICEVMERDATTLWQLKSRDRQNLDKVDISTITDTRCVDIIGRFRRAKTPVGIWDLTGDTGVPVFLCRILSEAPSDFSGIRPASGMGCHLSKNIALLRALTEAAQSRLAFISGVRDDLSRRDYKKFLSPEEKVKWHDSVLNHPSPKNFPALPSFGSGSPDRDIAVLLRQLRKIGIREVIAVDLTRPEFGIPVVRVIIPGLEGVLSDTDILLGRRARETLGGNEDS
ncbi:MAG: YcaO-like family protein [Pseudomonadota bacterium]